MQIIANFTKKYCKNTVPQIRVGYNVSIHQKIKEGNKERVQIFEGVVTKKSAGHGINETITVRKISEGIGVEKVFPLHAPSVVKIEVKRAHKVRRSNINFLRNLSGKNLRLKEIPFNLKEKTIKSEEIKKDMPETPEKDEKEKNLSETPETEKNALETKTEEKNQEEFQKDQKSEEQTQSEPNAKSDENSEKK